MDNRAIELLGGDSDASTNALRGTGSSYQAVGLLGSSIDEFDQTFPGSHLGLPSGDIPPLHDHPSGAPKSAASKVWTCCSCGDSPKNSEIEVKCTFCNHVRCSYCKMYYTR